MSDGGKGSSPRPFSVDQEVFSQNWDAIFKKEKEVSEVTDEQILEALEEIIQGLTL